MSVAKVTREDEALADDVIDELTSRKGLRQAFDNINVEIQAEIKQAFAETAARHRQSAILSRLEVAPAVSADEIDELLYSVIRMPLSNKGGELVRWRKTMSGRLSAILSRIRGEGE